MDDTKYDLFCYDEDGELVYDEYTTSYIVASDTDSAYLSLEHLFERDHDPKEVIAFSDEIGKNINKTFPQFMLDAFNCPNDYCEVSTDREKVCDVSLFLKKKNYILHIINSEGVDVDDTEPVGVEIKKSDTPVIIQKFLSDMVDMILDYHEFEDIRKFYLDFKESYMEQPIDVIAKPMQLNEFIKYQDMYEKTGETDGFTRQAKAVLNYNELSSSNDRKIRAGDSLKICYIRHKKYYSIAFPASKLEIPDFIFDFEVDYVTEWSKVVKKIERYLTPLGWDLASRKARRVKELLEF